MPNPGWTTELIPDMMAEESSPGHGTLSDDGLARVRLALQSYATNPGNTDDLRSALRRLSAEAREKAILPEQLLTTLKDLWSGMSKERGVPVSDHALLLQRVVTICIKEYYSPET